MMSFPPSFCFRSCRAGGRATSQRQCGTICLRRFRRFLAVSPIRSTKRHGCRCLASVRSEASVERTSRQEMPARRKLSSRGRPCRRRFVGARISSATEHEGIATAGLCLGMRRRLAQMRRHGRLDVRGAEPFFEPIKTNSLPGWAISRPSRLFYRRASSPACRRAFSSLVFTGPPAWLRRSIEREASRLTTRIHPTPLTSVVTANVPPYRHGCPPQLQLCHDDQSADSPYRAGHE